MSSTPIDAILLPLGKTKLLSKGPSCTDHRRSGPSMLSDGSNERPYWIDRGIFNTVKDPLSGELALGQAQHKMTETPARTKWACRPAGYDNEHIYLKYLGLGPTRLRKLKETGVI